MSQAALRLTEKDNMDTESLEAALDKLNDPRERLYNEVGPK